MTDNLNIKLPVKNGRKNELEPGKMTFDAAATQTWINFADTVERHMAVGGKWEQIRGFANKLPEHAARLAGVLALVNNIHVRIVGQDFLNAGIILANYYASEAQRLHEQGYIDPDIALAEKLLTWLFNNWKQELISLPDIYQRGLNAISDKKTALKIVKILEEHGCLLRIEGGDWVNGASRKDVWRIIGKS